MTAVEAVAAQPAGGPPPESTGASGTGPWRAAWRRLRRNPAGLLGAALVAVFVLVALLAPVLAPHEPATAEWFGQVTPTSVPGPSAGHPLGLDAFGSDLLTQLLFGARSSLVIGVVSTAVGLAVGAALGLLAGGVGGWVDTAVMRVVDVLLSIPSLLLAVSVAAVLGRSGASIMLAIAAAQVPVFARLLRASLLAQRGQEYVVALRSLGLRPRRIVVSHMLPNSLGPVLVQATLVLATAVIEVAALSFLGLGDPDPAVAEWGRMLVTAQARLEQAPHLALYPGLCIAVTALGFTLLGEALREALDPRSDR
ncbi:ABC transporter permease [Kineococcus arenarius]|uniref:ABC transporter permease n=1 Tax=Kineococcus sp. SYSU DK007 TaxID=3383128 RepID=UPI003D7CC544